MLLGAHMSIAGGFDKAVERATRATCDCLQIFTKNNNQWQARPLADEQVALFKSSLQQSKLVRPIGHNSYLINLGSPDKKLWKKSIDALVDELRRADRLGLEALVMHPGAYTSSSEQSGTRAIALGLDEVHHQVPEAKTQLLLETTAGQGTNLGWRFEQLAAILTAVGDPDRLGICFDTCHVFAAGYPLGTTKEYRATIRDFDQRIGLKLLKAFHLNDSKRELGSRVDRHEHIGRGAMGKEPFRLLVNDRRFVRTPMYLETPKGKNGRGTDWDVANLRVLRRLIEQ